LKLMNMCSVAIQLPVNVQTGEPLKWRFVDFRTEDAARAAQTHSLAQ
jgi:hypothetical protein